MTDIDPDLAAAIEEATVQEAVTGITFSQKRSHVQEYFPVAIDPWGVVHIDVDFDVEQLAWLEKLMAHANECQAHYAYVAHLSVMYVLGLLNSARVTYPSIGFPDDIELVALASFDSTEAVHDYMRDKFSAEIPEEDADDDQ